VHLNWWSLFVYAANLVEVLDTWSLIWHEVTKSEYNHIIQLLQATCLWKLHTTVCIVHYMTLFSEVWCLLLSVFHHVLLCHVGSCCCRCHCLTFASPMNIAVCCVSRLPLLCMSSHVLMLCLISLNYCDCCWCGCARHVQWSWMIIVVGWSKLFVAVR